MSWKGCRRTSHRSSWSWYSEKTLQRDIDSDGIQSFFCLFRCFVLPLHTVTFGRVFYFARMELTHITHQQHDHRHSRIHISQHLTLAQLSSYLLEWHTRWLRGAVCVEDAFVARLLTLRTVWLLAGFREGGRGHPRSRHLVVVLLSVVIHRCLVRISRCKDDNRSDAVQIKCLSN